VLRVIDPVNRRKQGQPEISTKRAISIFLYRNERKTNMNAIEKRFQPLFTPRSVAFIGASNKPGKWGSIVLANLIKYGFQGPIYPINPKEETVQGLRAYPRIAQVPETPDLAVIVVPPPAVLPVIGECVAKGVRAGVLITAGFAELGAEGARLQAEIADRARAGGIMLVGPNCNGIMSPTSKLHTAMPPVYPPPGPVAVVSQSGNVGTSIIRRGMKKGFGVSRFVSSGNEADLHCEDYFRFLAGDPETKVILSYIEGFRDGSRFFEIAREVTQKKPLIILKAGGTPAGATAAKSHTAALAGSDSVFDAICKQTGVIRADNIDDLANIGMGFIRQPLPQGRRVGIVTAGGGWGVLAADACAREGLEVPALSEETIAELDTFLPPWWTRSNPVDLVAGLRPDHLARSLECVLKSPQIDGAIFLGLMPALPWRGIPPSPDREVMEERLQDVLAVIRSMFDTFMGLADQYQKPVVVGSEIPDLTADFENRIALALGEKEYVCHTRPEDAAMVMARLAGYAEYLRNGG
jgi:acyl-CoA synthetase (NDP forming)